MHAPQPSTSTAVPLTDPHISHSYATRIRQNIVIKPSARLRQSPDLPTQQRKVKPTPAPRSIPAQPSPPNTFPQFPPPGIVLHPDDANSKVFLAIGRSFLSVDNRAMTIKDLAEMTVKFGLVCQNVSAASQAITTYIRTHMQRCEVQQDQPLLLRHVLSGTASDDDLLPALHSRSGGAHCAVTPDNRITNFRRGTMVWYMSRTTGAPCPFSRAGIRLCDYGEDGKSGLSKEKKKQRDKERRVEQQCGEKRKRPLRGCVAKGGDSDSQNDDERRPVKVKLTLRLKPLNRASPTSDPTSSGSRRIIDLSKDSDSESDDSQDSMSVISSSDDEAPGNESQPPAEEEPWSLPPYPRRSISIPCYTPCTETPYDPIPSPVAHNDYRRSPSIPYSIGSPPPDSEDEDDDFHITMTGARRHSTDPRSSNDFDLDWDADSEGDGETWESPGPRSPSAPAMLPEVTVKEESRDVRGMLEAWEDFDCTMAGAKVVEVIAQAAASVLEAQSAPKIKTEPLDIWSWESGYTDASQEWSLYPSGELTANIKQEDVDIDNPFYPGSLHSDILPAILGPSSPISPLSSLPYSDSPSPDGSHDDGEWNEPGNQFATVRSRAKTVPNSVSFFNGPTPTNTVSFSLPLTPQGDPPGPSKSLPELALHPPSVSHSLATLIQSMSMNSPTIIAPTSLAVTPPCISPHQTRCKEASSDVVVVHTCQPCTPAISATQIEGISVYQMTLGAFSLLRRIDTDFVNLSPIVAYSGAPYPVLSTIPNATTVSKGSPLVTGTWVPLSAAQAYVQDHPPLKDGPLDIFLSDVLFERFPTALQDFHRSSTPGRMLNHFGPHFGSTLQATQLCISTEGQGSSWEGWTSHEESHPTSASGPFALSQTLSSSERNHDEAELPLNATEQEIFHALCDIPDWDKDGATLPAPELMETEESPAPEETPALNATAPQPATAASAVSPPAADADRSDRPLRRSKRVAVAMAAQTQTRARSRRGGSRNSLS